MRTTHTAPRRRHHWISRLLAAGALPLLACAVTTAPASAAGPPEAPLLNKAPTAITATTATVEGELNPGLRSEEVEYLFAYNLGEGCSEGASTATEPLAKAAGNHKTVSAPLTGLEPSAQYAFCLLATNAFGATSSSPLTFTTHGEAPAVDAQGTAALTPSDATIEGQVNAENQPTSYAVEYATNEALTGASTVAGSSDLPETFGDQPATLDIGGGLSASTTYFYRVSATNATGTTKGTIAQLTTLPAEAPIVEEAETASAITPFDATLEAQVNPNYQETTYSFTLATNEALTQNLKMIPGSAALPAGFGAQPARTDVGGGLTPATTYYYRVTATNASGTAVGTTVESFTTTAALAPLAGEDHVSAVAPTSATLEAQVNPMTQQSTCRFEYGPTTGYGTTVACAAPLGDGGGSVRVELPVTGLTEARSYHFRVVAENSANETTDGPDATFVTAATLAPTVQDVAASEATSTTAMLAGEVNPGFLSSTCDFQYVTEASFALSGYFAATSTPCEPGTGMLPAVAEPQAVTAAISGLAPDTTYVYRILATNSRGDRTNSTQMTFTTTGAPLLSGGEASALSPRSELVTGSANSAGLATEVHVLYWTTTAYGASSPEQEIPAGETTPTGLAIHVEGLQPGTLYHYQLVATNERGTTISTDRTFTTASEAAAPIAVGGAPEVSLPASPQFTPFPVLSAMAPLPGPKLGTASARPPTLTRAARLRKALAACKRDRSWSKRTACERAARTHFAPANKARNTDGGRHS
jgi:phosphodiesterase/alkaline phosphatase D-like protein